MDKRINIHLNRRMQTLGLSSQPQPTDNLFKRLFWSAIESQYDVDLIGQQGFWVCTVVAVLSLGMMTLLHMPLTGLFTAVVFFLGGCGVRQRSVAAAGLVFALYLTNLVGGLVLGSFGNPLIQLIVLMLLFANVRATVLSRRWMAQPVDTIDQELPERSMETVTDKFANGLPALLWAKSRYAFFPLAGVLLLLSIAGVVLMEKQALIRTATPAGATKTLDVGPSN
ncbi:hypothetical protein RBB79_07820 [Tunturiibacter empetritectus]|uniref:Uncharacterized protein n=1 Tax=Tunturiibacter lichenicola TaxID=2051959 RepID=A0A852VIW4_9BACT|nr:hypothetical protein [Edaphobacter lichenicola]NYF89446.1 hypothetical protein [Edaphobacter lichenicola]